MNIEQLASYLGIAEPTAKRYLFGDPPRIESTVRLNPATNRSERVICYAAAKKYLAAKKNPGRKPRKT